MELPWPENPPNTYARHTEPLDCCFDLIRSHQQCILWYQPLEIDPVTTEARLYNWTILHTSDAKTLVMGLAWPINLNESCKLHPYSLERTRSPPGPRLPNSCPMFPYVVRKCSPDFLVRVNQFTKSIHSLFSFIFHSPVLTSDISRQSKWKQVSLSFLDCLYRAIVCMLSFLELKFLLFLFQLHQLHLVLPSL